MARPIASDYDDKRRAILKGAARLFADEGFGRASMAGVATACGISKANIYHYYDSKDALLFDILDAHLSGLRERICGLTFSSADPAEQLRDIISEFLLAYIGADAEHAVQLNAIGALPDDQQELLRSYQRDLVRFVRDRLQALAPDTIAQDPAKLRAVTMSVFAMINWHYQWDSTASPAARQDYAKLAAGLIIGGLDSLQTQHVT